MYEGWDRPDPDEFVVRDRCTCEDMPQPDDACPDPCPFCLAEDHAYHLEGQAMARRQRESKDAGLGPWDLTMQFNVFTVINHRWKKAQPSLEEALAKAREIGVRRGFTSALLSGW